jgi:IMP dehydrogenase
MMEKLSELYPEIDVMAGNVVTAQAAQDLVDRGAAGIKVGVGPGAICTTRIISGCGGPQESAIYEVSFQLRDSGIYVCADGGVRHPGDLVKAVGAGADSIMLGKAFAGTDESPGEVAPDGTKSYRGMGSLAAMRDAKEAAADRYQHDPATATTVKMVPEGVEATVPYQGSVSTVIDKFVGGLKSGMGYAGAATIRELQEKARFTRITPAGMAESNHHDVKVVNTPPQN